MPSSNPRVPEPGRSGSGTAVAGLGAVLMVIICCAGPTLLAASALGALGNLISSPWAIAAAAAVLAAIITATVRHHTRRNSCCPPTTASNPDTTQIAAPHRQETHAADGIGDPSISPRSGRGVADRTPGTDFDSFSPGTRVGVEQPTTSPPTTDLPNEAAARRRGWGRGEAVGARPAGRRARG